jgi:hypothetical protein
MHRRSIVWLPILLALVLGGCPPEDTPNGEEGRVLFVGPGVNGGFAADGAHGQMQVELISEPVTFSSSDPSVVAIAPDGRMTSGSPGTATISVATSEGEVDRIGVQVERPTRIEIEDIDRSDTIDQLFAGFTYRVGLVRYDEQGYELGGTGGYAMTSDGALTARPPITEIEGSTWRNNLDVVIVRGASSGTGTLTVSASGVTATRTFRIVTAEEIDDLRSLWVERAGGGPDSVAIRMYVQARAGGAPVGGATCQWEVVGAEIGLDEAQPDGTLLTDFWAGGESFSATCTIGSVRRTFDVVIADVPE